MKRPATTWSVDADGHVREGGEPARVVGDIRAPSLSRPIGWLEPFAADARDLLRVAMAVFQVDRLAPRRVSGIRTVDSQLGWQREIRIQIELEAPDRWKDISERLEELLWFLTDDAWTVTFKTTRRRSWHQQAMFSEAVPSGAELALFSGGLDSMAGLWARHKLASGGVFVAVSACGNSVRRGVQKKSIELLSELGADVRPVVLQHYLAGGSKVENTQRTRGILFYCVGAAVASTVRLPSVSTYESGPGAINLPLNDSQVGAQNTRANHPGSLRRLEDLFSRVLDFAPELRIPFAFHTKGAVCRKAGQELVAIAKCAISCDEGERGKKDTYEHCGLCTSCVLRRAAIYAAIGSADPTPYSRHATAKHGGYDLAAFHQQALRLKDHGGRWPDLLAIDPTLRHVETYHSRKGLAVEDCRRKLCTLFAQQSEELLNFYDACHPIALARRTGTRNSQGGSRDLFPATR